MEERDALVAEMMRLQAQDAPGGGGGGEEEGPRENGPLDLQDRCGWVPRGSL